MKNQSKGYKPKKKPKTKHKEDRRPHLGHWKYGTRGIFSSNQSGIWEPTKEETVEERRFHRPDIRRCDRTEWTLQEAHTLIDMWAEISWGLGSALHKEMSKRARYFRRLWDKQKGLCAVTGIELYGAPGCAGHGIGIDIINSKFGVQKGNIRLVSAPIAYTRYKCKDIRHGVIETMAPAAYERWPIFWAIIKHFQWHVQAQNPFSDMPVIIKFPVPTIKNQDPKQPRPNPWIVFEWRVYYPSSDEYSAWGNKMPMDMTEFAKVYFIEDRIHIDYLKKDHPRNRVDWRNIHTLTEHGSYDYEIQMCDPTLDFNKEIIRRSKEGFQGFRRWLSKIGEHW